MIEFFAPAKLNLYLHVTGKREDGYHLLDSLFCFASIGDNIKVSRSNEISLEIEGAFSGELQDCSNNSIIKAANLLKEKYGVSSGAKIVLEKNLPIASGIGGGSADAAATLLALNELWELGLATQELEDIALKIGADVPACLYRDALQVAGIGEKITKLGAMPQCYVLLVNPLKAVSTPAVFKNRVGDFSKEMPLDKVPDNINDLIDVLSIRQNDLYEAALSLETEIADVIKMISDTKGCLLSRMSGSGATCFGLYQNIDDVERALEQIISKKPEWWVENGYFL